MVAQGEVQRLRVIGTPCCWTDSPVLMKSSTRIEDPAETVPVGFVVTDAIVPRADVTKFALDPVYTTPPEVTEPEISPTAP